MANRWRKLWSDVQADDLTQNSRYQDRGSLIGNGIAETNLAVARGLAAVPRTNGGARLSSGRSVCSRLCSVYNRAKSNYDSSVETRVSGAGFGSCRNWPRAGRLNSGISRRDPNVHSQLKRRSRWWPRIRLRYEDLIVTVNSQRSTQSNKSWISIVCSL